MKHKLWKYVFCKRVITIAFPEWSRWEKNFFLLSDVIGKHKTVQMKEKCMLWRHKKCFGAKKLEKVKKPFINWMATGVLFIWSFSLFDDQVNSFDGIWSFSKKGESFLFHLLYHSIVNFLFIKLLTLSQTQCIWFHRENVF